MTKVHLKIFLLAPLLVFFPLLLASSALSQTINWETVPGKDIILFYPGQASWEWALTKSSHSGAPKFRAGKNCSECHVGEEEAIGSLIVSGEKLEPVPIERKRGAIPVNVKIAYDGERIYFRLEWTEQGANGFPAMDPDFDTKVTIMFDDGTVPEATRAGCWGTCHDDAIGMPSDSGVELRKYLSRSRTKNTRSGGGENYKTDAEIIDLEANGMFLEYIQVRLNHDRPPVAADGYVLKAREENPDPAISVTSNYQHGKWAVVISRPLQVAGDYRKAIVPGKTYTFGIAIHEAFSAKRFHHVSLDHTFALGSGDAELIAPRR